MASRPPERADLDALLDPLLSFAQETLKKQGEFYPFGAVMRMSGEVVMVAGYTGTEHPPSLELIETLREGMRAQAATGDIRAAGICYEVTLRSEGGKPEDAVAVALEHQQGDTVGVVMPYSKPRFGGPRFGDLRAQSGERHIFV